MREKLKQFVITLLLFVKSRKGAVDLTDKIINMVVAGLILFSIFGTMYAQYILANATTGMTASHASLLGVIIIMLLVGFVIMIWRSARGGR